MNTGTATDMETRMKTVREALDAHVREIVNWHFDPETGSPFWLDFAANLDWDPRHEIQTYDDLDGALARADGLKSPLLVAGWEEVDDH